MASRTLLSAARVSEQSFRSSHHFFDADFEHSFICLRTARTGAWTYLLSKGLDPGRLPISVVCCPYLSPPYGAVAGLGTDAAGNVLMAETIMIDRDGRLATRFGDGSGKLKKLGADGKDWFKKAAVRMHGRRPRI